jgi:hypothetical protein
MRNLTRDQKEIVIYIATIRYNYYQINRNLVQSKESKNLYDFLCWNIMTVEKKWSAIEDYLKVPENKDETLVSILSFEIKEAKAIRTEKTQLDPKMKQDFEVYTDNTKSDIIKTLKNKKDYYILPISQPQNDSSKKRYGCLDWNLDSFELQGLLGDQTKSLEEKWHALLEYSCKLANQNTGLYTTFKKYVYDHNMRTDYLVRAQDAIEEAETFRDSQREGDAEKSYNKAISWLKKAQPFSPETFESLADCEFATGQYTSAFDNYITSIARKGIYQLASLNSIKACQQQDLLRKRDCALDQMLKTNQYHGYISSRKRAGYKQHSFIHFGQSVMLGLIVGNMPLAPLTKVQTGELALLFLPLFVVGSFFGLVAGSAHGFFRAATRHPLTIKQQDNLIENLQTITHADDETKRQLISEINKNYNDAQTICASNSSLELLQSLRGNLTIDEKWQKIQMYMLTLDGIFFKNNGKKLFCIINSTINNYLQQPSKASISRTINLPPDRSQCQLFA